MDITRWQLVALVGWLMLTQSAVAQLSSARTAPRNSIDHPSHRYLPPPSGMDSVGNQVRALRELAQADADRPTAPLPTLSPAQLKQLDAIVDSFRNDKGELNIPSPDSIPQPLIDSLLPDRKVQQQVKDVLEEYARSRNLQFDRDSATSSLPPLETPQPNSDSNNALPNGGRSSADSSNANNGFQGSTSRKGSDRRAARSNSASGNTAGSSRQSDSTRNESARSSAASDASGTDSALKSSDARDSEAMPDESKLGESKPNEPQQSDDSQKGGAAQSKLAELQKLYKALQQIQQQRSELSQPSESARSQQQRNNPSSNLRPKPPGKPNGSAQKSPNSSGDIRDRNRRPGANPPRTGEAAPNNSQAVRPATQAELNKEQQNKDESANALGANPRDGRNAAGSSGAAPRANAGASDQAASGPSSDAASGNAADKPTEPGTPALTPFDEGFDFSKDQKVAIDPFAEPENAASNPAGGRTPDKKANRSASGRSAPSTPSWPSADPFRESSARSESSPQPQSTTPSVEDRNFDLKRSVKELGLGPALKRIVEKTIREQGLDPTKLGGSQSSGANSAASNGASSSSIPNLPLDKMPSADTARKLNNWANSVATSPGASSNNSKAPSDSQWGKWMSEVWKAVAEAPVTAGAGRSPTSSASSPSSSISSSSSSVAASPAGATGLGGQLPEMRWTNSMTVAVILVASLIGVLVWLSRRRMAELADASAAQNQWVRTVMAQGLKTRADVVRAFHQLVKQSRSVSDWWTHRSVVKHFNSQTPQLASAINELAIVYEQARYFPEDVELSQQQLAQVRTLLESVKIPSTHRA